MRDEQMQRTGGGATAPLAPNRSLVFVERRRRVRVLVQAPAEFVAQLIACTGGLEQYRRARRAEPAESARRYRLPDTQQIPAFERRI